MLERIRHWYTTEWRTAAIALFWRNAEVSLSMATLMLMFAWIYPVSATPSSMLLLLLVVPYGCISVAIHARAAQETWGSRKTKYSRQTELDHIVELDGPELRQFTVSTLLHTLWYGITIFAVINHVIAMGTSWLGLA